MLLALERPTSSESGYVESLHAGTYRQKQFSTAVHQRENTSVLKRESELLRTLAVKNQLDSVWLSKKKKKKIASQLRLPLSDIRRPHFVVCLYFLTQRPCIMHGYQRGNTINNVLYRDGVGSMSRKSAMWAVGAAALTAAAAVVYGAYRMGKYQGRVKYAPINQTGEKNNRASGAVAEAQPKVASKMRGEGRVDSESTTEDEDVDDDDGELLQETAVHDIPLHELDPNQKWVAIKDVVHGFVYLSAKERKVVDTPWYKALDDVRQLATAEYLYPSVGYKRKEHCFGCAHISWKLIKHLRSVQTELGITDFMVESVRMAGLFHDAGHTLYSHLDQRIFKHLNMPKWMREHETRGAKLFEFIVKEENLDYPPEQVKLIQHLMTGEYLPGYPRWLFMIVACEDTGFDTDKMSYIGKHKYTMRTCKPSDS
jgi:hypothetical protein